MADLNKPVQAGPSTIREETVQSILAARAIRDVAARVLAKLEGDRPEKASEKPHEPEALAPMVGVLRSELRNIEKLLEEIDTLI